MSKLITCIVEFFGRLFDKLGWWKSFLACAAFGIVVNKVFVAFWYAFILPACAAHLGTNAAGLVFFPGLWALIPTLYFFGMLAIICWPVLMLSGWSDANRTASA